MNQKLLLPCLGITFGVRIHGHSDTNIRSDLAVPVSAQSEYQLRGVCQTDTLMKTPGSLRPLFTDRGGESPVTLGQGNIDLGWMASYSFRNQNSSGIGSSFSDQFSIGLPVVQVGVLNNLNVFLAPVL